MLLNNYCFQIRRVQGSGFLQIEVIYSHEGIGYCLTSTSGDGGEADTAATPTLMLGSTKMLSVSLRALAVLLNSAIDVLRF